MPDTAIRSLDDQLTKLAEACRIFEMEGHGDKTLGHVSLRDPEGRGAWIKRSGIALGEARGPDDFVLVGDDGKVLSGSGARSAEWPIHTEIYRARREIEAIAHTYPFHACVLGTTEAQVEALTRDGVYFRDHLPRYRVTSNLITTVALGRSLAEMLGDDYAMLIRNHGVVFCGRSIAECVVVGLMLERTCRAQYVANASGLDWTPARTADQLRVSHGAIPERDAIRFWNYYRRKLSRASRHMPGQAADVNSRHVS